ncbi:hypothetical protein IAT38_000301 [Cryptococcus sp. DSM 104549]
MTSLHLTVPTLSANPSSSSSSLASKGGASPTSKPRGLKKLRPWSLGGMGRRKDGSGWMSRHGSNVGLGGGDGGKGGGAGGRKGGSGAGDDRGYSSDTWDENAIGGTPYTELRVRSHSDQTVGAGNGPRIGVAGQARDDGDDGKGYEWEDESESEVEVDTYSWVDPSIIGTDRFRATPAVSRSQVHLTSPPDDTSFLAQPPAPPPPLLQDFPDSQPSSQDRSFETPRHLAPDDSYALLLAYQATSDTSHGHTSSSDPTSPARSSAARQCFALPAPQAPQAPQEPYLPTPTDSGHIRNPNPEWHEIVDRSFGDSLSKQEQKRQGLWWEMIKGEREYVRDMKIVCDVFIQPLRECEPPILSPPNRLHAFVAEVFSSAQQIYHAHLRLLGRLMERQRHEWPLITSATDILLQSFLEITELYEAYMKNYPFAEARVRRETTRNPAFRQFLASRNTASLTLRRDISVFLSRPVTRLPRILLILEALYKVTPEGHADREDLPAAREILQGVVRGTQPGIESAEAKIKIWNVAERLLFRKGEIVELDIADPKRMLVHMGYVFRRVRSETNWHGWQDLHAILLDNYFLLTRDEEHGKHVVISRPIHLDFLEIVSADGVPERRYDCVPRYRKTSGAGMLEPVFQPERLMFPFTISIGGASGRTYTLCTAEEWKEKIEGAKTLRKFDVESNRIFAVHTTSAPLELRETVTYAETFTWHGRETMAISTDKSVWLGWKRDNHSYRELIRFNTGHITTVSLIAEFAWLLVVTSGSLIAFSLNKLMPTSDNSTWVKHGRMQGDLLSQPEHVVAWARVGVTKDRVLVVYAIHARNSHHTTLHFLEPLLPPSHSAPGSTSFRPFASLHLPGYASSLTFFRQTIAVITEKTIVIAEPGNPVYNSVPTVGEQSGVKEDAMVVKLLTGSRTRVGVVGGGGSGVKPLGMWQVGGNEFLLVYDWGACFVTKFGELSRSGAFLRWNLTPSYAVYRSPYLLLFDELGGRAEVRDISSGKVCEVVEEPGMKMMHETREGQEMLGWGQRGLLQLVETVAL